MAASSIYSEGSQIMSSATRGGFTRYASAPGLLTPLAGVGLACGLALACVALTSCGGGKQVDATANPSPADAVSVAVAKAVKKNLDQHLTVSSELVPLQEIPVYAKESGYIKELNVDYGARVKKGDVMAVLEIPEFEATLQQDDAAIKAADEQVKRLGQRVTSLQARWKPLQETADELATVAKTKPGLVAQQEVSDAQGRALTAQADIDEANANVEAAKSQAEAARDKKMHDSVLFDYAKITAPFDGVVTQRYANYGSLMQAGTNSSTQAMPLVQLSEDDIFRLVIPVEESYVRFIHLGDPVTVEVPSLNRTFLGKIKRFSNDVKVETRTMHTEVEVLNPDHTLLPGLYANATIQLQQKRGALSVPLQALDRKGDRTSIDVINASNQIEIRNLTTGIDTADDIEVLSGVKEGELVVVGDRSGLKSGESVNPKLVNVTEYKDQQ